MIQFTHALPDEPSRAPPEVIQLPLPARRPTRPAAKWTLCLLLLAAGGFHVYIGWGEWGAVLVSLIYFALAVLLTLKATQDNSAYFKELQTFLDTLDELENRRVAEALRALWQDRWHRPGMRRIVDALQQAGESLPRRSLILCCGTGAIPRAAAYRFEPEIITPTRRTVRSLWAIAWAVGFFCVMALLYKLQHWCAILCLVAALCAFVVTMIRGVRGGARWALGSLIQPTYFRIAPGMIQTLRFRVGRRPPLVRSFPIEFPTAVVVEGSTIVARLHLARHGRHAVLDLRYVSNAEALSARIWHALLSTVPTPPLSDEELVG